MSLIENLQRRPKNPKDLKPRSFSFRKGEEEDSTTLRSHSAPLFSLDLALSSPTSSSSSPITTNTSLLSVSRSTSRSTSPSTSRPSSPGPSPSSTSPSGAIRRPTLLKIIDEEGKFGSTEAIKLNSSGLPQARKILLSKTHLYLLTPKKKKCKRRIPLSLIASVSLSPHWDGLLCIHTLEEFDLLLVLADKRSFLASLQAVIKEANPEQGLSVNEIKSFEFRPLPGVTNTISFDVPDGTVRKTARVFVDWKNGKGVTINPCKDAAAEPPLPPAELSPLSERINLSSPPTPRTSSADVDIFVVGDGIDDRDSEDEVAQKKIKVRESTLLSKMMNVIPVAERGLKNGNLLEQLTSSSESYVFYKWLLDPEEPNPAGFLVREWQIQGGRDYMEDVVLIDYQLKNNLGDLMVCLFDGHGGRECADWLATNIKGIVQKHFEKPQFEKDMKKILHTSYLKAHKKVLVDKTVKDAGSTALVTIFRNGKVFIANTGDTRAVVFRPGGEERLTIDHRVTNPKEYKRLTEMGAMIKKNRVYVKNGDINLARAIGDRNFQPYIIPDPDYFEYKIGEDDEFIVIATDGIWDTLSEEDVARTVRQSKDPKKICSLASIMGSKDNLSAIIVFLKGSPQVE